MPAGATAAIGITICVIAFTIDGLGIMFRKNGRYLSIFLAFSFSIANASCSQTQEAQSRVQRVPLEKRQWELKSPVHYAPEEIGYDRKGRPITYDHKPRVEMLDAKAGKYLLKWIGYDRKEKTVVYQRIDAVDVIVSASVSKTPEGYLYSYQSANLPSSGTYLSGFILQNYAKDARPYEVNGVRTTLADLRLLDNFRNLWRDGSSPQVNTTTPGGILIDQMSNVIEQFSKGSWINFAPLPAYKPAITPGRTFEVKLLSSAPPGLVECRVTGGDLTIQGVDEELPAVLEDMLPGYEQFPHGNTIGPVEYLKNLPQSDKAKYILDRLPVFRKVGWITDQVIQRYEPLLKKGDLASVINASDPDLKAEQITTEVFAILQGMK
jgi:hypothetical protein